jgi:putative nucleotide binding protein
MTEEGANEADPAANEAEPAADDDEEAASSEAERTHSAVVLDYLPHGRADDDRPQYQKSPIAQALGVAGFGLFELALADGADVSIDDEVPIDPPAENVDRIRRIDYDELSSGARSELEYLVRDMLDADEERLVDFYNEAGPITLRLHQLNLLPGIGDKLRDDILDARKRRPFESLADVDERISGLHQPREIVVERIMEELRDEDVKYKLFVRPERDSG